MGVSFVRFTGIDRLLADEGHQATADALHSLVCAAQDCADTEGVTFLATDLAEDGGKVILVAGFPTTGDDDQGRLLRASRHIVQRSLREAWPIQVQAGLNRGHVFAGAIGSPQRATVTVMGDTVNLAARVMTRADPGQVLATPATLDNAQTLFRTEPVEPFMVKGKTRPVTAYLVEDETGTRPPRGLGSLPFLGRDTELATITTAVDALAEGSGSVLTLIGDAGMGKTRLLREALSAADDGDGHARLAPSPTAPPVPYRPVRDPLRRAARTLGRSQDGLAQTLVLAINRLDPDLIGWAPLIGDVLGIPLDPTTATRDLDPQVPPRSDRRRGHPAHRRRCPRSSRRRLRRHPLLRRRHRRCSPNASSTRPLRDRGCCSPLAATNRRDTARAPARPSRCSRWTTPPCEPSSTTVPPLLPSGRTTSTSWWLAWQATRCSWRRPCATCASTATSTRSPRRWRAWSLLRSTHSRHLPAAVVRRASVLGRSFRTSACSSDLFDDDEFVLDDATPRSSPDILEPDGHGSTAVPPRPPPRRRLRQPALRATQAVPPRRRCLDGAS